MRGYFSCIYGGDAESSFRHSNGWTPESDVKLSEGDVGRWRLSSRLISNVQATTQSQGREVVNIVDLIS